MPNKENPFAIVGFEAKQLFGYIDQHLKADAEDIDAISRLMVLYGENGTGKTNLLKIAFHLISPYPDRGHKTMLFNMLFKYVAITLRDGTKLSATRESARKGKFTFSIKVPGKKALKQTFLPDDDAGPSNLNPYTFITAIEKELFKRASTVFFLNDDRSFDIEDVDLESDMYVPAMAKKKKAVARQEFLLGDPGGDITLMREIKAASVARVLRASINRMEGWFNIQYGKKTSTGMASTHGIYQEVIEKLSQKNKKGFSNKSSADQYIQRLEELAKESAVFEKYGISVRIDPKPMIGSIKKASGDKKRLLDPLLDAYVSSVEARFKALRDLYKSIDTFVSKVNYFFSPKKITYSLGDGLKIYSPNDQRIRPDHLSSGERQLLLILTNAVLTGEYRTLFVIDEPEISLNVTWQREIIPALLDISSESNSQFIMASHSISMIQSCKRHVLRLSPAKVED